MVKKLATVTVIKSADWRDTVINTLKEAGFTIIEESDLFTEKHYIIGEKESESEDE